MSTYADTWKSALGGLQETELRRFVRDHPEWQPRLDLEALDRQGPEERAKVLGELLPVLLAHARQQGELWTKIDGFRGRAVRAAEARWRLEVRAAALQRMRTILLNVAGRVLVARREAQRPALAALQRCESFAAGTLPDGAADAGPPPAEPFPPLSAEIATLEDVSPSWLGVRFRAVTARVREAHALTEGAILLDAIYPDSPAQKAGLQVGDIVLGPPGQAFQTSRELREWTLMAPRGVPLAIAVFRPDAAGEGQRFKTDVVLGVAPVDWPKLPDPPRVGEVAPGLGGLLPVAGAPVADLDRRAYLLFFWATWCGPCKRAVPEVLALSASRDLPVLAISDEDADTVRQFLADRKEPFMTQVAVDPLRKSFQSFGVSGTPTLLLVDAGGVIRHRQVGYTPDKGVTLEGWTYKP
jgi:thiol-disulfide isomerase/thioredoxin